ncbi:MAG: ATP-binding protein [Bacteroidales bacterium]|nr:ATP-binding protein [Bacteroidales bacterium]
MISGNLKYFVLDTYNHAKKVVITGPESSGKSTLTKELADFFNTEYYSEYARTYIENLSGKYTYDDLISIAKQQIKELSGTDIRKGSKFIFYDTGLIITKVWFEYVFHKVPNFLLNSLREIKIDCYLLCYPDLPWKPDNVRENGGNIRFELFEKYKKEIEKYKINYLIIRNKGNQRFLSAKEYLSSAYCL